MTPVFLSDADAWMCVCSARLAELQGSADLLGAAGFDSVARALQAEPAYASMDPVAAAGAYLHGLAAPAE